MSSRKHMDPGIITDKLAEHISTGFWWLAGLVSTITLFGVGAHMKNNNNFKRDVNERFKAIDRETDILHKRITDGVKEVAQNHPSNKEFELFRDMMETQFKLMNRTMSEVSKDVREIRDNK